MNKLSALKKACILFVFFATTAVALPAQTFTTLYNFCSQTNCADGHGSDAGLVQGTNGKLYGTTTEGGGSKNYCHPFRCGTVFDITSGGALTTLHAFDGPDGIYPDAPLVEGTDGKFYGTTYGGGANTKECQSDGCGTVFSITASGKLTTLYNFCSQSNCTDGNHPNAALVEGTDGNFYGTTNFGGQLCTTFPHDGCGTIFEITPDGTLTTLHTFEGTDGAVPAGTLVQDTNGTFYGTTAEGGSRFCARGCGTAFSLSVGLGPFVRTNPVAGKVGSKAGILGTDLTGATSVTFNGTVAQFTVKSETLIITTVPQGATTGTIQVQLPGGTLSSSVPFIVLP